MKAFITNNVNGRSFEVTKDSLEDLTAFVAYQKNKANCPWGALEKELEVNPDNYPDRAEFLEVVSRQEPEFDENFNLVMEQGPQETDEFGDPVVDEEGNPVYSQIQKFITVTKHKVRIPQEFTVLIDEVPEDLSETYLAEVRAKIELILDKTDWLFVSDVILPTKFRTVFKDYRTLLRLAHDKEVQDYTTEESYTFETFDNFVRRTMPQEFLDGGEGEAMIKKFNSKLKDL